MCLLNAHKQLHFSWKCKRAFKHSPSYAYALCDRYSIIAVEIIPHVMTQTGTIYTLATATALYDLGDDEKGNPLL